MEQLTDRQKIELNEQTKISFKPTNVFVAIGAIFIFGAAYASINSRLSAMEALNMGKEIQFIRESVIRIEGKLDLKQDKYEKTKPANQ